MNIWKESTVCHYFFGYDWAEWGGATALWRFRKDQLPLFVGRSGGTNSFEILLEREWLGNWE
jgi:hypothetical protein